MDINCKNVCMHTKYTGIHAHTSKHTQIYICKTHT